MVGSKSPQEALMRLTQAYVHVLKGSARAAVEGFQNYSGALTHENLFERSIVENGFMKGLVAGWATALYESAMLAEQAFGIWRGDEPLPARGGRPQNDRNRRSRPKRRPRAT